MQHFNQVKGTGMRTRLIVGMIGAISLLAPLGTTVADAQKPAGVIDSVDAEWSGVQTDLLEVKRMSDNTIRVRWRWRNTTGKKVHLFSSDGARDAMKEQTYLIDPVNKKKHFVVTDAQGKVVGTALGFLNLDADQSFSAWAKFPAPPPNVEKVTVVVAKTPPFEDIPIAK
jgi:hypothetical protein